ncbi:MAG: efflux RND transporter periplasmic adaptor subunit [Methylococcales bacterium]
MIMIQKIPYSFILLILISASAFSTENVADKQSQKNIQRTPITITKPTLVDLEIWESSVGQIEPKIAPLIAAEVAGKLISVNADVGDQIKKGQLLAQIDAQDYKLNKAMVKTEINRLNALIHAQQLKSKRHHDLMKQKVSNQSLVDDVDAQLGALKAQLATAQVKLQQAQRELSKTRIVSPIDGFVDETQVSTGDYVKIAAPLMRIGNLQWLKVRLPYPESLLSVLHPGQTIHLTTPAQPDITLESTISEVRPSVTYSSRSAQVIVNVENPGGWKPGATITAQVRTDLHKNAMMLAQTSIVLRPSGTVVYVVSDNKVSETIVTTGLRKNGQVEILSGIKANDTIALDGAGFLTDNANIKVVDK